MTPTRTTEGRSFSISPRDGFTFQNLPEAEWFDSMFRVPQTLEFVTEFEPALFGIAQSFPH